MGDLSWELRRPTPRFSGSMQIDEYTHTCIILIRGLYKKRFLRTDIHLILLDL